MTMAISEVRTELFRGLEPREQKGENIITLVDNLLQRLSISEERMELALNRMEELEGRIVELEKRDDATKEEIEQLNDELSLSRTQTTKLVQKADSVVTRQNCLTIGMLGLGLATGGVGTGLVVAAESIAAGSCLVAAGGSSIIGSAASGCAKKSDS